MARVLYYPYGETRYTEGTLTTDYGYTGQRNEAGLGLMDYAHLRCVRPLLRPRPGPLRQRRYDCAGGGRAGTKPLYVRRGEPAQVRGPERICPHDRWNMLAGGAVFGRGSGGQRTLDMDTG